MATLIRDYSNIITVSIALRRKRKQHMHNKANICEQL